MRRIAVASAFASATLAVTLFATPAPAGTLSGVAIGAGTGAIILGPIGAVAGGVVGAIVGGPDLSRGKRFNRPQRNVRR